MSQIQAPLDPDELKAYSFRVWNYKQGEMVALMIHLGDRLGIYQAMDGAGPLSPAELASQMGLQERWLLEWMRGQAAAQLLDYHDDGRFELSSAGAAVLADEEGSIAFASGAFTGGTPPEIADKLADAFRTGVGLSYEEMGPNAAHRTERMLGTWVRMALVPQIIPALDGVHEKLEAGAVVADVGCGSAPSKISSVSLPKCRTIFFAVFGPTPLMSPDPRYFSSAALVAGLCSTAWVALNCRPYLGLTVQAPKNSMVAPAKTLVW